MQSICIVCFLSSDVAKAVVVGFEEVVKEKNYIHPWSSCTQPVVILQLRRIISGKIQEREIIAALVFLLIFAIKVNYKTLVKVRIKVLLNSLCVNIVPSSLCTEHWEEWKTNRLYRLKNKRLIERKFFSLFITYLILSTIKVKNSLSKNNNGFSHFISQLTFIIVIIETLKKVYIYLVLNFKVSKIWE